MFEVGTIEVLLAGQAVEYEGVSVYLPVDHPPVHLQILSEMKDEFVDIK